MYRLFLADFLYILSKQFIHHLNFFDMGNLLYIIAVILIVIWAISFLGGFFTGGIIHILLVIAVIMIALKLINRTRV